MRQFFTFTYIVLFVMSAIAATSLPQRESGNLKVLPKDISDQKLESIMGSYNKALGIGCDYCHDKKILTNFR